MSATNLEENSLMSGLESSLLYYKKENKETLITFTELSISLNKIMGGSLFIIYRSSTRNSKA